MDRDPRFGRKAGGRTPSGLIELAGCAHRHLRRAAIEAIGLHPPGRPQVIRRALHERDGFTVRAAAEAAATLRLYSAHECILSLVASPDEATRLTALRALEALWRSPAFERVFDRYAHDPSDQVRKQAAWTLHGYVGAEHWQQVFSAWSRGPLPRHRVWACQVAAKFGTPAIGPALEVLRIDTNGHVRRAAHRAMRQVAAD